MRYLKICRGTPISNNPGKTRIVCGAILLGLVVFVALIAWGEVSASNVQSGGTFLMAFGIWTGAAAGLLFWGLNARFRWFGRPSILLDDTGLWYRDGQPPHVPWGEVKEIREAANNVSTPDFPAIEVVKVDGSIRSLLVGCLNRTPPEIVLAARNYHRRSLGLRTISDEATHHPIPCPQCGHPSASVKCYRLPVMLFLWVAGSGQATNELGCPSCIRGKIRANLLVNLVTANVAWPFVILPWGLVQLARSFTQGHSRTIVQRIEESLNSPRA